MTSRYSRKLSTALFVASAAAAGGQDSRPLETAPRIRGDSASVAAAERLLQTAGGRSVWRRRTFVVEERVYQRSGEPLVLRISRDFTAGARLVERVGPSGTAVEWIGAEAGWTSERGLTTPMTAAEHAIERLGLAQEPYAFYHLIAIGDSTLRVELRGRQTPDARLMVYDGAERVLGWFNLDARGALAGWGCHYDGTLNQHHYGPVRMFGEVGLPRFGAASDGRYYFEYMSARLDDVPFAMPSTRW